MLCAIPWELTRPAVLLLLLAAAPLLTFYFIRSLSDFPRPQRIVSLVVRLSIVTLLILALAGLTWLGRTDQQFVLFVLDHSLSVDPQAAERADAFLEEALRHAGRHQVAYLPFADQVGIVSETAPPWPAPDPASSQTPALPGNERDGAGADGADTDGASPDGDSPETPDSESARTPGANNTPSAQSSASSEPSATPSASGLPADARRGTNIAAALEAAAGSLPPGRVPRIVLISDGNQTAADAVSAASRSRAPISTVLLPTRSDPEVQVSEVLAPAEVREGEPFHVEAVIYSNHEDEGLVEIYKGDHKVVSERRKLQPGENRFRFQQSLERARLAAYTVRVSQLSQDTLLDNNLETGLVYTAGKPRVLVVESDPNLIRDFAYALEQEGIQVDIRPPQGMPESLADLQNYELLVVSNVPATALSQQQMEVARTYVQQLGGGFMMLGGEQSFGLGGYYKSALEEILPVRSDFQKEKETPSLGMVLVIDKSGSMSGEKMEMAKSAARGAAELLGRRDQLGVVAFNGSSYVISEIQSASNKAKISDEIARIDAGGGTSMFPAMEMAYEMLSGASAKLKHVILLTDGVSEPGDFEGMSEQMVSAKMTVSTVAVGQGAAIELLETIARIGRGRYYFTEDPSQVPQIFAKETVTASKSAINEQPFLPQVIRATHALEELDLESAPFLLGFVMTRPKPTSEVILATESGEPLLAWWRYGLGMSTAFTSDVKTRWAAEWITWEGYSKFWTQVVRQTMRKSDARGILVDTRRSGGRASVGVDAVDAAGQFLNDAEVELTLIEPGLQRRLLTLDQSAPGRYQGEFASEKSGTYHLEIAVKQNDQVLYRQSRGLTVGYSDELRIQPPNAALMRSVAEVSGGEAEPSAATLFDDAQGRSAVSPTPLWPYLLTAALLLLVLDVALRRIDFSLLTPLRRARG